MNTMRARIVHLGAAVLLGLLAPALASRALSAPVPCEAKVEGSQRGEEAYDEYKDEVFAVQIQTREGCAKVYFDLVVTETLFNGEEITSTQPGWRKVQPGEASAFKIKFRMARDSEMVHWEIKYKSCEVCGT